MKNSILIHHPKQINKQWAQKIINHHLADASVRYVAVQSINVGTTTRIKINVEHDAGQLLPANWFIKSPSLVLKSRMITALPRLLHKEISFYTKLAQHTPLKLPPMLAAQSVFGWGSTLVMADLTELAYSPGQPQDNLSVEQARQVITHLAKMHGYYWQQTALQDHAHWLNGFNTQAENHLGSLLAIPLMKRGLNLAGDLIPAALFAPALKYAKFRRQIMRSLMAGPQTLVHHDCHPGNFFWQGSEPGFLDWQLLRIGEGIGDVAYFLATSLIPETRREHEQELLALYQHTLAAQGIQGLDQMQIYQRYRAHLTYPFEAMVVTLAIGDMMDDESTLELIRRTTAAVIDHDSFAALEV